MERYTLTYPDGSTQTVIGDERTAREVAESDTRTYGVVVLITPEPQSSST